MCIYTGPRIAQHSANDVLFAFSKFEFRVLLSTVPTLRRQRDTEDSGDIELDVWT